MSLLIDNGLVLSDTTSTNRNTINSNGNNLEITTTVGDLIIQTSSASANPIIITPDCNFGGNGEIHKLAELRGRSSTQFYLNAVGTANLRLNTNNSDKIVINNAGVITFSSQPRLNTATSSTTTNQWMSMNNCMTMTTFNPTLSTSTGSCTLDATASYGKYMRMADLVYVVINVVVTGLGTAATDNAVSIGGLPFAGQSGQTSSLNVSNVKNISFATVASCFDILASVASNASTVGLSCHREANDDGLFSFRGTQLTNTFEITVSGFYLV